MIVVYILPCSRGLHLLCKLAHLILNVQIVVIKGEVHVPSERLVRLHTFPYLHHLLLAQLELYQQVLIRFPLRYAQASVLTLDVEQLD